MEAQTNNLNERSFKEIKRRVKVREKFPTEESCIHILFALLHPQNDVWEGPPSSILEITPIDKRYPKGHPATLKNRSRNRCM